MTPWTAAADPKVSEIFRHGTQQESVPKTPAEATEPHRGSDEWKAPSTDSRSTTEHMPWNTTLSQVRDRVFRHLIKAGGWQVSHAV